MSVGSSRRRGGTGLGVVPRHPPLHGRGDWGGTAMTRREVVAALDLGAEPRPSLSRHARSQLLEAVAGRIADAAEEVAHLITWESGLACATPPARSTGGGRVPGGGRRGAARRRWRLSRDISAGGRPRRGHTPREPVRRRGDHPVQPPAEPGGAQGRTGDRGRGRDGAEAVREDPAHGAWLARTLRAAGLPEGASPFTAIAA